jgi:hypothetical protein
MLPCGTNEVTLTSLGSCPPTLTLCVRTTSNLYCIAVNLWTFPNSTRYPSICVMSQFTPETRWHIYVQFRHYLGFHCRVLHIRWHINKGHEQCKHAIGQQLLVLNLGNKVTLSRLPLEGSSKNINHVIKNIRYKNLEFIRTPKLGYIYLQNILTSRRSLELH